MKFSTNTYTKRVVIESPIEDLQPIHTAIDELNKEDIVAHFPSLSIDDDRIYFLPQRDKAILNSREVLKTGYQSLLGRLGIPLRVTGASPLWVEVPLVNGTITHMAQRSAQQPVLIRLINREIRAVLSSSYTAIDDKDIISLLEDKFLPRFQQIIFNCDADKSHVRLDPTGMTLATYGNYMVNMFLYISNSEIGDASVRCGVGINIRQVHGERNLSFEFARDNRTLGRVIHRGEAIKRLETQVSTLFEKSTDNWTLIQDALLRMSNVTIEELPTLEERMIKTLQTMPEFQAWKTQYDEMRKTSVVTNMFDLIYLMTSIPYKDEHFNSIVEEILYGRFF